MTYLVLSQKSPRMQALLLTKSFCWSLLSDAFPPHSRDRKWEPAPRTCQQARASSLLASTPRGSWEALSNHHYTQLTSICSSLFRVQCAKFITKNEPRQWDICMQYLISLQCFHFKYIIGCTYDYSTRSTYSWFFLCNKYCNTYLVLFYVVYVRQYWNFKNWV